MVKRFLIDTNEKFHREIKARASKEGMTLREAVHEALAMWLNMKLDQETAAQRSGAGIIGRAAADPVKFRAALEKHRNQPPIDEDEIMIKS